MSAPLRESDRPMRFRGWRCGVIRELDTGTGLVGRDGVGILQMVPAPLLVVKLGGSLLSRPAWPAPMSSSRNCHNATT